MKKRLAICFCVISVLTGSLMASEKSWLCRMRMVAVEPHESSRLTVVGGEIDVSSDLAPELDISYFLTNNISIEAMVGMTRHNLEATGSTVPGVGSTTLDLGKVSMMPSVVSLSYHFPYGNFKPYVGAGFNYTIFTDVRKPLGSTLVNEVDYDNSVGYVIRSGFDYFYCKNWCINFDVKKMYIGTDASVATSFGGIDAGIDLDPWILALGIGYSF